MDKSSRHVQNNRMERLKHKGPQFLVVVCLSCFIVHLFLFLVLSLSLYSVWAVSFRPLCIYSCVFVSVWAFFHIFLVNLCLFVFFYGIFVHFFTIFLTNRAKLTGDFPRHCMSVFVCCLPLGPEFINLSAVFSNMADLLQLMSLVVGGV